jgi:hypothetical protein
MKDIFIISLLLLTTFVQAAPKSLNKTKLKVDADGVARQNTIASFDITSYADVPIGSQIVVKTADGKTCQTQVIQCFEAKTTTLYWRIDDPMTEKESRNFVVEIVAASSTDPVMAVVNATQTRQSGAPSGGVLPTQGGMNTPAMNNLILKKNNVNVLQYNTVAPRLPGGVDQSYRRNGFIHPVWSPAGNVLTNINPTDHWHHYGIWNPWTSVEYNGNHYDLWNINDKTGTVRFDSLYRSASGDLFADILVRHRHIIFEAQSEQITNSTWGTMRFTPKHEKIIMDELQDIRVWNLSEGTFLWDLDFTLYPCTDLPVILKEYRYAGLGWRATPDWTKENCVMITSEGKTRQEIDGTKARWIYITGMSPLGKSGIMFMASPKNHNFPEPLRIWDETQNGGRGDAFINFAPTKDEDWILEPGKSYDFRYRIFVFDGDITPDKAEAIWKDYATPVKVTVTR